MKQLMRKVSKALTRNILARSILISLAVFCFAVPSFSQTNACTNPALINSVIVNISTIVTTQLVTNASTEQRVYVCSFTLTMVGNTAANTITFEYGTGSLCGTGTVALTGPIITTAAVGNPAVLLSPQLPFKAVPVANNLCVVTTTTDKVTGVLAYVVL